MLGRFEKENGTERVANFFNFGEFSRGIGRRLGSGLMNRPMGIYVHEVYSIRLLLLYAFPFFPSGSIETNLGAYSGILYEYDKYSAYPCFSIFISSTCAESLDRR